MADINTEPAVLSRYPKASKQWFSRLRKKSSESKKKDDHEREDDSLPPPPPPASPPPHKKIHPSIISEITDELQLDAKNSPRSISKAVKMEKSRSNSSASSDFATGALFERSSTYKSLLDDDLAPIHISWDVKNEEKSSGSLGVPSVIHSDTSSDPKEWSSVVDSTTGKTYWRNKYTRETTWTRPSETKDSSGQEELAHSSIDGMVRSLSQNGLVRSLSQCGGIEMSAEDFDVALDETLALEQNATFDDFADTFDEEDVLVRTLSKNEMVRSLSQCGAVDVSAEKFDSALDLDATLGETLTSGQSSSFLSGTFDEEDINNEWFLKEYRFAELPPPVRDAAELLGYTEAIWDNFIPAPSDSIPWKDLTEMQKSAALRLGYSPRTWNKDDSSLISAKNDYISEGDDRTNLTLSSLEEDTLKGNDEDRRRPNKSQWSGMCHCGGLL